LEACKKKFNLLFKAFKLAKMANDVSRSYYKECNFFEEFDEWWHQTKIVTNMSVLLLSIWPLFQRMPRNLRNYMLTRNLRSIK
jgi:hypothetical protein